MSHLVTSIFGISLEQIVILYFLILCRVGGCFMILPGFAAPRIPMKIRLFVSIALSIAISPIILHNFLPFLSNLTVANMLYIITTETIIGFLMGACVNAFFLGLSFAVTTISASIGIASRPTRALVDSTSTDDLNNFFAMTAIVIFFATNMHIMVIQGIVSSYNVVKPIVGFDAKEIIIDYNGAISSSLSMLLRIASPFILYSILANVGVGMVNKLTPIIPIYFVSTAALAFGGLFLLYLLYPEIISLFSSELRNWIATRF